MVRKKIQCYFLFKRTKLEKDWQNYKSVAACNNAYNTYLHQRKCHRKPTKKKSSFYLIEKTDITGVK